MKTSQHNNIFINLSEKGFTIVELAIAITLALFVTGVTYMAYITQQRSYVSQEQVGEMQSSTLVSLSMLTRDIREAGFGITPNFFNDPNNNINGQRSAVRVENGTGANFSDRLFLVGGFRELSALENDFEMDDIMITVKDKSKMGTFSTLAQWTSEQNEIRENQKFGRHNINLLGVMLVQVTAINEDAKILTIGGRSNPVAIPAESPIYIVEDIIYQIEKRKQNDKEIYELIRWSRFGMPNKKTTIAENIENMQVNVLGNRVDVQLLARTEGEDPIFENQGKELAFDDASATWHEVGTTDGYRRRIISLSVARRN